MPQPSDPHAVDAGVGGDPRPTLGAKPGRTWVQRAERDRRARARLRLLDSEGVIVLNDRRDPGSGAPIPMIAVSSAGVFVVDAKHYKGLVHTRRSGPVAALGPEELHVGRRDCTPQVRRMAGQVELLRRTLGDPTPGGDVPVEAMFCLTRAAWGFASPLLIDGVWVGWPQLAAGRVQSPGTLDPGTVQELSSLLADRLPTG